MTNNPEEIYRWRCSHPEVYQGITQKAALAIIEEEYPECTKQARVMLQEGGDVIHFLSILDSFYWSKTLKTTFSSVPNATRP